MTATSLSSLIEITGPTPPILGSSYYPGTLSSDLLCYKSSGIHGS